MAIQQSDNLNGGERELEMALRKLKLAPASRIDPFACAFAAGQHVARRRVRIWKSVAVALSIALASAIALPRAAAPALPGVAIAKTEIVQPLPALSALRLRDAVLLHGLSALPRGGSVQPRSFTLREFSL